MPSNGIQVAITGEITPTSISDTFPVLNPYWGLGGLRTVSTLVDRDAITTARREYGMLVFVSSNGRYYKLETGLSNLDWTDLGTTLGGVMSGTAGGELTGTYPNPSLNNDSVISKTLTGFTNTTGTITSSDTLLSGIQKLSGNSLNYLTTASASATYLTTTSASNTYLKIASASNTYLSIASASSYLTTASASATYLTTASASATYLGKTLNNTNIFVGNGSNVATGVTMSGDVSITNTGVTSVTWINGYPTYDGRYLTIASASNTYLTTASASNTYLTTASASATYLAKTLNNTNIFVGNGSNVATGVAMSGDATISNTGVLSVAWANGYPTYDGRYLLSTSASSYLTTASASATYLSRTLTNGYMFIGNGSNIATGVTMSGDASITNTGVATVRWVNGYPTYDGRYLMSSSASSYLTIASASNTYLTIATASATYLSKTLTNGYMFVGNVSNVATGVTMSGDVSLTNTGVATVNWTNGYSVYDTRYALETSSSLELAPVLSILSTPPVSPTTGDRHLIGTSSTGVWLGKDNQIAEYNGTSYDYTIPVVDNIVYVTNTLTTYRYTGTAWTAYKGTAILQNGNTLGANITIGTNDNYNLQFKANNNVHAKVTTGGTLIIGSVSTSDSKLHIKANTINSSAYAIKVDDSNIANTNGNLMSIRNDGVVVINGMTIGKGENQITSNLVIGENALANSNGIGNTAIGKEALRDTSSGQSNTGVGYNALRLNTTGSFNTALGQEALRFSTIGNYNTAVGSFTLIANTSGSSNTSIGYNSMNANTTGYDNTANGYQSLFNNVSGLKNTAIGYWALRFNTSDCNTAVGSSAGANITTGDRNTVVGFDCMPTLTTGKYNTAIGWDVGRGITTGNYNTIIGAYIGTATTVSPTLSNTILISEGQGNIKINIDGNNNTAVGMRVHRKVQVNAKVSGNTLLFTTDSNKGRFIVESVWIHADNIAALGVTAPTLSVGWQVGTNYSEFVSNQALPNSSWTTNQYSEVALRADSSSRISTPVSTGMYVRIGTASDATTYTITVIVSGFYLG